MCFNCFSHSHTKEYKSKSWYWVHCLRHHSLLHKASALVSSDAVSTRKTAISAQEQTSSSSSVSIMAYASALSGTVYTVLLATVETEIKDQISINWFWFEFCLTAQWIAYMFRNNRLYTRCIHWYWVDFATKTRWRSLISSFQRLHSSSTSLVFFEKVLGVESLMPSPTTQSKKTEDVKFCSQSSDRLW